MALHPIINRLLYIKGFNMNRNADVLTQAIASLWAAAVIGSWFNFLTVIYIGFVAAHTLPILYERYDDQVDAFVYNVLGQLQQNYRKLNSGVLSRIPKGKVMRAKKAE